jgi:catechol 2,3-dioxygenase-like lactoylglutathione lyase family enzyme
MAVLRRFYHALGWSELSGGTDEFSGFHLGGVLLALYPLTDLAAEAAPGAPGPAGGWSGVTLACNVDTRDEVDRAFADAVAAGATAVAEPTDRHWGGRSAYFADPEGHRWEIAWAPMAKFDERGALASFG